MIKEIKSKMTEANFTGVKSIIVSNEFLNNVKDRFDLKLEQWNTILDEQFIISNKLCPNIGLVLNSDDDSQSHILARTSRDGKQIWPLKEDINIIGQFKSKNKEQTILYHFLNDQKIRLHVIIGKAGSGKTFLVSSYALNCLNTYQSKPRFKKIVLTRSFDTVGGKNLGAVPGTIDEKFSPYLLNFKSTFDNICGSDTTLIRLLEETVKILYLPIELMRGASFNDSLIVVDEAQNLDFHQTKTIGTRLGEGSALIFLADLSQIDRKGLKPQDTGIYHLMHSSLIQNSPLAASIELVENVRSDLSNLIDEAFKDT